MVCVPEHVRLAPSTIVEAQFSIPYTVAAAWIDGGLGMNNFTEEGVKRKDVLELTARVKPYVDADIDRNWSRFVAPAKVTIEFRDGQTAEARVDYPKGHPKIMMMEAEFAAKTTDCATYTATPMLADTADRLIATAGKLETLPDMSALLQIMTGSSSPQTG